ncbi:MAG: cysteine synthase family protein [Dehalococcoidales bacterium]|jgi:cysteine synthase B|nr:cysteine synthase family protein [Dehalococcoidales bacterium]
MYFNNALEALGHTPLVELPDIVKNKKVHILAKLEGQNLGGSASTKDRVAKYMLDTAVKTGQLNKDKTIIEATSGNTGISLAWLGKKMGYNVTIVMPENMSKERQQLIRVFGAELILTEADKGVLGSMNTVKEMVSKSDKYYMPDQFANPANPIAHYETTGVEILDDFPYDKIDYLIAGIGTGGTIVGVTKRLRENFPQVKTIGVEPPPGDCIQGLRCLETFIPPVLDLSFVSERVCVTSTQANEAAKTLLRTEGIFCGQSSGALIHQAVKIANSIEEGNIVAVLPDGGWKYLSLDFWTKQS